MRKVNHSDRTKIIDILAAAFDDNKSVNYVAKQDHHRERRIRKMMDYSFDACYTFGEIWITDDERACALVEFPDQKRLTAQSWLWDIRFAISVVGLNRVGLILQRDKMIRSNHPKEPIAYVWFIGVQPGLQGKGMGSTLVKELIEEYEQKKRPIYLETSMNRNLPFYKNLGFEIFQTLELSYTLYLLRREIH